MKVASFASSVGARYFKFIMRSINRKICYCFIVVMLFSLSVSGAADTQRIYDYEYDGAGNIIRVVVRDQTGAPKVDSISPIYINRGRTVAYVVEGENLLQASVVTEHQGLRVSNVVSSLGNLTFDLSAEDDAELGEAVLIISSGLGAIEKTLVVAEKSPEVATSPNPIALGKLTGYQTIVILFSEPRPEDEIYDINTDDESIILLDRSTIFVEAGESRAEVQIQGLEFGSTSLTLRLDEKYYAYRFPVFVTTTFIELFNEFPDMVNRNLFTKNSVGVFVQSDDQPLEGQREFSPTVGLYVGEVKNYFSDSLSLQVGEEIFSNAVLSQPVGINLHTRNPVQSLAVGVNLDNRKPVFGAPTESIVGPLHFMEEAILVSKGVAETIGIAGVNLGEVYQLSLSDTEDLILGDFSVNEEGTELQFELLVEEAAASGKREILMTFEVEGAAVNAIDKTGSKPAIIIQ